MKNVAQKTGVSVATVSHVINETRFVREGTKKKVLKAMKELNYYPNFAARSLRSRKSNVIGLLVPDISILFFTSVVRGVENAIKKHGYTLMLSDSGEKLENEIEQIKIYNTQLIDGLIMAPVSGDHTFLNELLSGYFPVVFIDRKPEGYQGDCILVNNIKGTYDALSVLIEKGHTKIGIITGLLGLTTTEERLIGYKKVLTDYGLKINKNLIKVGDSQFESGYKLTKELLEHTDITALFVTNDLMTVGAMHFLKEKQVKVPNDLAIIGFDDCIWASITDPPLTVIKQPSQKIGEKATELLIKRIKKEEIGEYKEYRLPTRLVIRDSC